MTKITSAHFVGQTITGITLDDESVTLAFERGTLQISDDGQSCCEHRYMSSDDDLQHHVGCAFLGWEIADVPDQGTDDGGYDVHEIEFLNILTSNGSFQIASHNVHNGYYGGFHIQEHARLN